MMRAVVFALGLVACAPTGEAPKQESGQQMLPAPTPEDVAVRITSAQEGQSIEVGVNQRFAVELVGVPTAGYVWQPAQMPAFVTRAGEAGGNTIQEQSQPGYAGGNHWEVLMFTATATGTGELVLEQRRPWESTEPPADTFRVTIVAR
jgi:inhibitor of cysteine peptidase